MACRRSDHVSSSQRTGHSRGVLRARRARQRSNCKGISSRFASLRRPAAKQNGSALRCLRRGSQSWTFCGGWSNEPYHWPIGRTAFQEARLLRDASRLAHRATISPRQLWAVFRGGQALGDAVGEQRRASRGADRPHVSGDARHRLPRRCPSVSRGNCPVGSENCRTLRTCSFGLTRITPESPRLSTSPRGSWPRRTA